MWRHYCLPANHDLATAVIMNVTQPVAKSKTSFIDRGLVIDGLGVLASIAEAVPVLGAPVKGSVEALKQIVQYTQVRAKRPSPRSRTTD
jgi:hypothetical protein